LEKVMDVRLPDGMIVSNVPDNMTKAEFVSRATANGLGASFASPQDRAIADPTSGMSGTDRFLAGAGKSFTDLARGAKQLLGSNNQAEIDESRKLDAPLMKTGAGIAGNIGAGIATALPTFAIPGVNTLTGAAAAGALTGALQPVATGESRGTNTMLGGALGAGGQVAGNAIGRVIRPVRATLSPEEQRLAGVAAAHNIPLSAAQQTGSRPLQVIDSVLENLPLTSGRQLAQREAQQQAFNRSVGGTFGAAEDALTPDVMGRARAAIGQRFTDLSARNSIDAGQNMLPYELGNVMNEIRRFSTGDVARIAGNRVDDLLNHVDQNGRIPGQAYRQFDSALGRQMRSTTDGDLRHALGQIRDTVRNAMDASISPADAAAWRQARGQYANLMTVAPVAARNESGNVSGRTLLGAANTANRNARFGAPSELAELGRVGRAFVADQIPNSGTAQRAFYQSLLMGGLGGGIGYAGSGGDPAKTAGTAALALGGPRAIQALLQSQAGQRYMTQGILQMTPQQQAVLNAVTRGGMLASPQAVQQ
jgi:hypothetical protein